MEKVVQAVLLVAIAAVPAMAANYDITWNSGVDYGSWASGKSIQTGDSITFSYGGLHSVYEVSKADYDACATSNSMSSASDGNTVIALSKPGTHYFICGTSSHCDQGMKIAVPVSAAASTTPPTSDGSSGPPPSSSGGKGKTSSSYSPGAASASLPANSLMGAAVVVAAVALLC